MLTTKQRILKISEKLFFEQGIANVRLQQIADNSGISIGNLAYHFKNKEVIVEEVYNELLRELAVLHSGKSRIESLKTVDDYFTAIYNFQQENGFYLNNFWEIERTYPKIKKVWQRLNNKMLQRLSDSINSNVENGNLKKADFDEAYDLLANSVLLTLNYRIPQQILRSKPVKELYFKQSLWNLLYPYFTPKGKREYKKLNIT
ncbi:MAG: TetR/AcrR family transcriptional regulator [Ginsengibacter sp.]